MHTSAYLSAGRSTYGYQTVTALRSNPVVPLTFTANSYIIYYYSDMSLVAWWNAVRLELAAYTDEGKALLADTQLKETAEIG